MTAEELAQAFVEGKGEEAYESTMLVAIPFNVIVQGSGRVYISVRGLGTAESERLPETLDELKPDMSPSTLFCFNYISTAWTLIESS